MKCKVTRALISEYLDQTLPPDVHDRMTEHLASCAGCRREMEEIQQTLGIIRSLSRQEPVINLWEEFASRMQEVRESPDSAPEKALGPRLTGALREGWATFITVTVYNNRKTFRIPMGPG